MSATWLQALRAYTSRKGPPSTLASRHQLYDQIAQTHLAVRDGNRVRAENLAVLREARWALLRDGTTNEKAKLLEHIMKSLARASEIVTYAGSATVKARAPRPRDESVGSANDVQSDSRLTSSSTSSANPSSTLENTSERHQLLLEQVQCLVEAKVSEIPLTARHYRYPLRSPLLAEVSADLPLLLLDELSRQPRPRAAQASSSSMDFSADWEARVDCCASLAGAGHAHEALALCEEDGRMFRAALQRVLRQRRDGWQRAWALAEAVPTERVVGVVSGDASPYSEDWLRGVLEAVQLRFRATSSPQHLSSSSSHPRDGDDASGQRGAAEDDSVALFKWVDQLRRLVMPSSTPAENTRNLTQRQKHAWQKAQRLVMDAYLSVCPPSRWREAVGVVLELEAAQRASSSSSSSSVSPSDSKAPPLKAESTSVEVSSTDDMVRVGRVMSLLQFAEQPWMTLLFFYGNALDMHVAAAQQHQQSGRKADIRWSATENEVQSAVEGLLRRAREANRLAVAAGALLRERDVHHAAVYNHAMAALAATGHHDDALLFYSAVPVACVNAYTHWGLLQLFLQPNSSRTVASALASSRNYELCQQAVRRLVRTMGNDGAPVGATAAASVRSGETTEVRFTRDQANVWESMTLWAALRCDAGFALLCATHAPPACRYVHLIALIAAANDKNFSTVQSLLRRLCKAPRTTRKELCLAAAVTVVYYPLVAGAGSCSETSATTPDAPPELAAVYSDLTHALGKRVGHQQTRWDEAMQALIQYVVSLQRRRRSTPVTAEDAQSALQDVLVKANILNSTMDLVRLGRLDEDVEHNNNERDNATALWRTTARLIQAVGSQQDLSVARAAPAMVSAGAPAEVAIDLLPS